MMSISPAFGQSLPLPSDQYAGQTPQPWGIAKMSAMNSPRVYAFLVLTRMELRLPPTAIPSEASTAMTTVSSDWTNASFLAALPETKFTRPCVGSSPVKKSQPLGKEGDGVSDGHMRDARVSNGVRGCGGVLLDRVQFVTGWITARAYWIRASELNRGETQGRFSSEEHSYTAMCSLLPGATALFRCACTKYCAPRLCQTLRDALKTDKHTHSKKFWPEYSSTSL